MDYGPILSQLAPLVQSLRAQAGPGAPAHNGQYDGRTVGGYDGGIIGNLSDLQVLTNYLYQLPEGMTSNDLNTWNQSGVQDPEYEAIVDDGSGGRDLFQQRADIIGNRNQWQTSDQGKAYRAASDAYYATPEGQQRKALEEFYKQASMANENRAGDSGGWLDQRLDDTMDFVDKYGLPITMALLAGGVGSAFAGAASAAGAGSIASGAAGGAAAGGTSAALTGQSVGKGLLGGAALGGLGGAVSSLNPASAMGAESATSQGLINGAIKGGVTAGIKGGNVLDGALAGGASGGISRYNPAAELGVEDKDLAKWINSTLTGGATAALTGGDISNGLLSAGVRSGVSGLGGLFGSSPSDPQTLKTLQDSGISLDNFQPSDIGKLPLSELNLPSLAGFEPGTTNGTTMDEDYMSWLDNLMSNSSGPQGGTDLSWLDELMGGTSGNDTFQQEMDKVLADSGNYYVQSPSDQASTDSQLMQDWTNASSDAGGNWLSNLGGALKGGASSLAGLVGGGGNLAALVGGALGASQGGKTQTNTTQQQIDPRMAQYLYGSGYGDQNSLLGAAQNLWQQNKTGINDTMQQGLDMQKAALTSPAYSQTYQGMQNLGNSLMSLPIASNPFAGQQSAVLAGPTMKAGGTGGLLSAQDLIAAGRGLLQ